MLLRDWNGWQPGNKSSRELLYGARAGDEDIHETAGALPPVRARGDIRDADQSAEEIEGFKVFADVAAFDRAFHQHIDSSANLTARSLKYF